MLKVLPVAIRQEREGKEETIVCLFAYKMSPYLINIKDYTRKLSDLINTFRPRFKIKIDTQKSTVHLYTVMNLVRKKNSKNSVHNSLKIKYLRISLTKRAKDPYDENLKTPKQETETCYAHGLIEYTVKIDALLKLVYKFNKVLSKFH